MMSCKTSNDRNHSRTPRHLIRNLVTQAVMGMTILAGVAFADPPARAARISFAAGAVSFRPGTLDEWTSASLNYPLTIGDHLWTDRDARSELEIGTAVVRVAPSTELSILNLDDRTAQFRITQGAVSVRVRSLSAGDVVEIDTPNGAVSLLQPGLYRIDVDDPGNASVVTVRRGAADASAAGPRTPLQSGQTLTLSGPDGAPSAVAAAAATDPFEDWCLARDRAAENVQSARYVSPETIGYQDLDANGAWQTSAEYGPIWYPRVRAEWAPYRYGRWVWVDPWGWTWIDEAPWGFAPFHYGRWVFVSSRWAWVPGTMVARPVYAPALVAFVGGSTWTASFGIGAAPVAWFPLGPREVFVPAYRVTPVYVQRINAAHVTNVNVTTINVTTVTYVNRTVPGAVTAVSQETFIHARPVATAAVVVTREQVHAAAVIGSAAVAPERVSIVGEVRTRAAVPPQAAVVRQVVVRTPPPPPPVPFAARRAALDQHPGEPVDASSVATSGAHPLVRGAVTQTTSPAARPVAAPKLPPPAPQAPAPVVASPPARPPTPPATPAAPAANTAAAQAQERAELNARHAQERAALQTRHEQERKAAGDAHQREQLKQRQQQEVQAMQERHRQEHEAVQKKQQQERKP